MHTISRLFLFLCCIQYLIWNSAMAADSHSWANLATLQRGDKIFVIEANATKERVGTFLGFDPDALALRVGTADLSLPRTAVVGVYAQQTNKRVRNALLGVAIGAGVGLLVDQTLGRYLRNESNPDNARALIWATPIAVGGTLGAVIPSRKTVYKRK